MHRKILSPSVEKSETIQLVEKSEKICSKIDSALELRLVRDSFFGWINIKIYSSKYKSETILSTFDGEKTLVEKTDKNTGELLARYYLLNDTDRQKAEIKYEQILDLLRKGEYDLYVENEKLRIEFNSCIL